MTPDTIAIITVWVALAGLMVLMFQMTYKRLDSLEQRCVRIEQRFDAFETRFSVLEQRQARLGGANGRDTGYAVAHSLGELTGPQAFLFCPHLLFNHALGRL